MTETELHLGKLTLGLAVIQRQVEAPGEPYRDWLMCDVRVQAPGFSGRFQWNVMPGELVELARNLEALHSRFPEPATVTLRPTEPNVELAFTTEETGHINGTYAMRPNLAERDGLTGSFVIGQSYLPCLVNALRAFVRDATDCA